MWLTMLQGRTPPAGATRARQTAALTAVFLLCLLPAVAQTTGSLQGHVTDPKGAVIPGAQITVRPLATNVPKTVVSDRAGFYSAPSLPPGEYLLSASSPGFASVQVRFTISLGESRVLDLRLQPGHGAEPTASSASAVGVHTSTSSISGTIDSHTVSSLPVDGRDVSQAATLEAGVAAVRTQQDAADTNAGRGQRGFGQQISVSGGRPQQNNYLLDGISLNDYANSSPGSVLGLDLGADAVEQFQVVTSNYPAEYGRSSGGIINAVTRSGSNVFHGSVYEFLRNSAMDARNYFDQEKPPFRRNQFGASAGGPIRRNRTFFFANYEGLRQSLGVTREDTVPSLAARQGQLSSGPITVDPAVVPYLGFYPPPNSGLLAGGDTGIYSFSGQQITGEDYVTGRVDHQLAPADNLSGSYSFDRAMMIQPDEINTKIVSQHTRRQAIAISEAHVFNPHLSMTSRVGVSRVVAVMGETPTPLNPLDADTSLGFVPGHTAGKMSIVGLTDFTGGLGGIGARSFHWTSYQAYNNVSLTSGGHTLNMGFSLERMHDNMLSLSDPGGEFIFHSLSDFLQNKPFSLSVGMSAITPRDLRQTVVGAYLQDDYRIARDLTLNMGVRYEMATVPTETAGRLATLRDVRDAQPHTGNPYFSNPTSKDFEPRVGFAWDPRGKGKAAVRAGFGIFDVLPLPYEFELLSLYSAPFFLTGASVNLPAGTFPTAAFNLLQSSTTNRRTIYVEPNPKRNYVMQWNLNIELQPGQRFSTLIGYVGSRGVHQPFRVDDANIVLPTLTLNGYLWPSPVNSGQRLNANVGRLDLLMWRGNSYYHGLQVQAKLVPLRGLQLRTSYTFGKSTDTGSATMAGDQFSNSVANLPWYDLRLNRGPSDFNIAQNLSVHFAWTLPAPQLRGPLHWLSSGWETGGTVKASTGVPFTLLMGGDPLGERTTSPVDYPDRISGPGCDHPVLDPHSASYINLQCFAAPVPLTRLGNLGRNSLTGPGLFTLDLYLHKDNLVKHIAERFNVQLRLELFNALNHTNFSPPLEHLNIFDQNGNPLPGAGMINSTQTSSREIQVGLKLIW